MRDPPQPFQSRNYAIDLPTCSQRRGQDGGHAKKAAQLEGRKSRKKLGRVFLRVGSFDFFVIRGMYPGRINWKSEGRYCPRIFRKTDLRMCSVRGVIAPCLHLLRFARSSEIDFLSSRPRPFAIFLSKLFSAPSLRS